MFFLKGETVPHLERLSALIGGFQGERELTHIRSIIYTFPVVLKIRHFVNVLG